MEASTYVKSLGGNAANVAIGLSRLGTSSRVLAKVGDDIHGRYLKQVLEKECVDVSSVITDSLKPTAQCYVFTTLANDNTFLNWPPGNAASLLTSEEIKLSMLDRAEGLHATGISMTAEPRKSAVLKTMKLAHDNDIAISFDAGFPTGEGKGAQQAVKDALELAHIIKVNLAELVFWTKHIGQDLSDIPKDAIIYYEKPASSGHEGALDLVHLISADRIVSLSRALMAAFKPNILLVTMANKGSLVISGKNEIWIKAFSVDTIAGVGAGDAYLAGFLHSLTSQSGKRRLTRLVESASALELEKAGLVASAVGAINTTNISAHEGLPRQSDVDRLMLKSPSQPQG